MRTLRYLLIISVLIYSCSTPKSAVKAQENSLLWEISGKDIKTSYLYGTIHIICPEDFRITEPVKQKISEASKVYFEIDMDNPSMLLKTMQLSIMPKGSLRDLFTDSDYAKVNRFVSDSLQLPMIAFNKMKPFTLMSLLYTKILPCGKTESYEQTFLEMAKSQKKDVEGLETLEDQFAVFDNIPDSAEARMLIDFIDNFQQQRSEFARMVELYKKEDLQGLYDQMSSSPDMAGYEDQLLVNRNQKWIPVMQAAMKNSPIFFAVGAGHLPGDKGVIHLLRQAGYTVKPVK